MGAGSGRHGILVGRGGVIRHFYRQFGNTNIGLNLIWDRKDGKKASAVFTYIKGLNFKKQDNYPGLMKEIVKIFCLLIFLAIIGYKAWEATIAMTYITEITVDTNPPLPDPYPKDK